MWLLLFPSKLQVLQSNFKSSSITILKSYVLYWFTAHLQSSLTHTTSTCSTRNSPVSNSSPHHHDRTLQESLSHPYCFLLNDKCCIITFHRVLISFDSLAYCCCLLWIRTDYNYNTISWTISLCQLIWLSEVNLCEHILQAP